jgi:hypothetical protein
MSNDGLSNTWIVGIASVVFDTDEGQRIEHIYTPHALSGEEETDVAFHSFPVWNTNLADPQTPYPDICV